VSKLPSFVLATLLLVAALGCGGGNSAIPPPPPAITGFSASQGVITTGTATTLVGDFTGGTGAVDQGVGAVTSGKPVATGNLLADTTFTLTVTNPAGVTVTAATRVGVVPLPTISSFTNDGPIAVNGTATLTAIFAGGSGVVTPGALPITSGVPITTGALAGPTTFTITVTSAAGATATATTTVTQQPSTASLAVALVNPPAGATVRVFGPNGYTTTLAASGTLTGLAAGTYTLVPAGILVAGQDHQAAGPGTVAVGQGAAASATITYAAVPELTLQIPDVTNIGSAVELTLVPIPAGTFQMGAYAGEPGSVLEERPQHAVTLSQTFYMAVQPTTQALWKAVTGKNPSWFSVAGSGSTTDDPTRPVEFISWNDLTAPATGFLALLNAAAAPSLPAGLAFRLPTEAEWEYACRGGTTTRFYWGDDPSFFDINFYAWWDGDSGATTHPVGSLGPGAANGFGLSDCNGNVFQWCQDWFGPYTADAQTDPQGPPTGDYHIVRGGDWYHGGAYCRSANRSFSGASDANSEIGFRLVLAPVAH